MSEITCHAVGAHYCDDTIRTIVDVGGQDVKAIALSDTGSVLEFAMNDKCAAGTGRFYEAVVRTFDLSLEEFSRLSLKARKIVPVTSQCTVFAESELVSLLYKRNAPADIAAGVQMSVAKRVFTLARRVGVKPGVAVTGGCSKNQGLIKALEKTLRTPISLLSMDPQLVGALGAAVLASRNGQVRTRVAGVIASFPPPLGGALLRRITGFVGLPSRFWFTSPSRRRPKPMPDKAPFSIQVLRPILVCAMAMLAVSCVFMTQAIFLELAQGFQVEETQARLSFSFTSLFYGLSFLLVGPIADRVHQPRMAFGGAVFLSLAVFTASWVHDFHLFLALMAAVGMGASAIPASMFPYMVHTAPPERMGAFVGLLLAAATIGVIVGRLVMGLMTSWWDGRSHSGRWPGLSWPADSACCFSCPGPKWPLPWRTPVFSGSY